MIALTLTLLIAAFDGTGDEPQAKPGPAAAPAQDPDRPALSPTDLKALRENNIFAPKGVKRVPRSNPGDRGPKTPIPYKQKPPVVTGIFLDVASQTHQAIVEDKNDSTHKYFKEPKFMKVGDEWAGLKLESITPDKAVFNKGGTSKEVHIGESLPETDEKVSAGDPSDDAFADDGDAPPAESATTPSAPSTSPSKIQRMSRPDSSRSDGKTVTPETQSRTLEEMKRRLKKKNRPGDTEE